uniref:Uncharacterized protein n=1 Tax=Octopus bimaculoides TaxID=37653 RepID=A0A0L8IBR1_OCTBM
MYVCARVCACVCVCVCVFVCVWLYMCAENIINICIYSFLDIHIGGFTHIKCKQTHKYREIEAERYTRRTLCFCSNVCICAHIFE